MAKTLLLADDSVTIQRVIELTFTHEDVRVVSVSDGRRAVQWMEGEWPDIVLADVNVPEVDGYALAAHVKQSPRLQHVPVLLLAGAFEPVDQARVAQIGCDGVLIKPFEPQQLVTRVRELLARPVMVPSGAQHRGEAGDRTHMDGGNVTRFPSASGARGMDNAHSLRGDVETAGVAPEPLEPPDRDVWELGSADAPSSPRNAEAAASQSPAPPPQKVSLVSAFSALLAAEQSTMPAHGHAAAAAAPITEATVEDAVRRVLVRMTDDLVRRLVLETAERLIKEEIEKIKSQPE
jgi:CheY-like chemotaxis protein